MNAQRLWIIGGVVAAVVIVALGWVVGISPRFHEASAADAQYEASQQQETAEQAALASLEKQYDGIAQLKAQLAELQTSLPASRNISDFLRQLDALAKADHVTLGSIGISPATAFTAPSPPPAAPTATPAPTAGTTPAPGDATPAPSPAVSQQPAAGQASTKGLYTLPVSLTAAGSRAGLLDFLSGLQNGDGRLFTVSNVNLSTGSGAASTTGGSAAGNATAAFNAAITGAIYVLLPSQ